jgi:hypothetical protein
MIMKFTNTYCRDPLHLSSVEITQVLNFTLFCDIHIHYSVLPKKIQNMSFSHLLNMLLFFYNHTFSGLMDFAMPASQNGALQSFTEYLQIYVFVSHLFHLMLFPRTASCLLQLQMYSSIRPTGVALQEGTVYV